MSTVPSDSTGKTRTETPAADEAGASGHVADEGSGSTASVPAAKVPAKAPVDKPPTRPRETGGPAGLEPTRYGDWEKGGRCIDF